MLTKIRGCSRKSGKVSGRQHREKEAKCTHSQLPLSLTAVDGMLDLQRVGEEMQELTHIQEGTE